MQRAAKARAGPTIEREKKRRSKRRGSRLQNPQNCHKLSQARRPFWRNLAKLEENEMQSKILSGATIAAAAVALALAGVAAPTSAAAAHVAGKAKNHCRTQKAHCKAKVHCRTQKAHCKTK